MHSDWAIWDFFKANSDSLMSATTGIFSYYFTDPYSVRFIRDEIPKDINSSLITLTGKDITVDWIEENFETLSLFGTTDSFYVLEAQDIGKDAQKKLLSMADFINDRALILVFMEKMNTTNGRVKAIELYNKLKKIPTVHSLKLTAPKPWEWDKLFSFLSRKMKMNFDTDAKMMFIEMVNQDIGDYLKHLNMLQLEYGDTQISLKMLKEIISDERFNKFQLCETFLEKEFLKFFEKLVTVKLTYPELLELFNFIQTQLIKVADPKNTEKKEYKTKFDKKILAVKNIWNSESIRKSLNLLADLSTKSKSKDPMIFQYLTTLYNRSFH